MRDIDKAQTKTVHSFDLLSDKRLKPYRGAAFSFEGVDGGGKSTQYLRAVEYLDSKYKVVLGREPGGTCIGERIRDVLLSVSNDQDSGEIMSPQTELLLFQASRAQLVDIIVKPALERGDLALLDRFDDSSTAYQGGAGGLDLSLVLLSSRIATQNIRMDKTYVFDVRPDIAQSRIGRRRLDRIEAKVAEYHKRVRESYHALALLEPNRVKLIDTSDISPDEVFEIVKKDIDSYLEKNGLDKTLNKKES